MEQTPYGGACVGHEAKIVDVEKDREEGHGVRVGESQVGMVTVDGVNEVGDVFRGRFSRRFSTKFWFNRKCLFVWKIGAVEGVVLKKN